MRSLFASKICDYLPPKYKTEKISAKFVIICLQTLKWKNFHKNCDYLPLKFKVEKISTKFVIICLQNLKWKKLHKICDYLSSKFKVFLCPTSNAQWCFCITLWASHFERRTFERRIFWSVLVYKWIDIYGGWWTKNEVWVLRWKDCNILTLAVTGCIVGGFYSLQITQIVSILG